MRNLNGKKCRDPFDPHYEADVDYAGNGAGCLVIDQCDEKLCRVYVTVMNTDGHLVLLDCTRAVEDESGGLYAVDLHAILGTADQIQKELCEFYEDTTQWTKELEL